ncbi:zinc-dependent alcohol dehydrogenase [Glutamicibacter soli]|uniref:zinc-dependent alcohol dehydrogenase n=1 Tax=Glutamicibacter soli TaxID=453836 RepID=UPI003FD6572E
MKTVAVTKIGSLRDPNADSRGRIGLVEFPEPKLGPEDVRIRVAYSAICGSDPHLAEGFFGTDVPIGLGHELSGVVEALGGKAQYNGLKIGDRVAGNFLRFCGICTPCRGGHQQFCEHIQDYNRPGMAETVTWHESQVYKLPDNVSLLKGCLLEPTSVAVRIADKANIKVGDRVAICGGGPIGQLALQVLKMSGATSLTLIEPIAKRREMALKNGADAVIDPFTQDQHQRTMELTDGVGFDVVIDASGAKHAVAGLLDIAGKGATVVYGAMYPHDYEMPLNISDYLYLKELTLTGVFVSPYAFPRALQILPHLRVDELTNVVFDLQNAEEAFSAHISGDHPKIVIRCNDIEDGGEPR